MSHRNFLVTFFFASTFFLASASAEAFTEEERELRRRVVLATVDIVVLADAPLEEGRREQEERCMALISRL